MRQFLVCFLWLSPLLAADLRQLRVAPAPGTRFALEVEKTGLLNGKKHLFLFERYNGILQLDPAAPEKSSIQLEIESGSAIVKDDWVSPKEAKKIMEAAQMDVMEAKKYPTMKFVSTAITSRGNGAYDVQGNLTIRNVTHPVLVSVTEKDGVCEGKSLIKLTDFKIKPPSLFLGAVGTKNEMTVTFLLKPAA